MGLLAAAAQYLSREPTAVPKSIEITEEYRDVFVVEAREHLDEWESALLDLEHRPDDAERINEMFRAIHTLKGSAGFIGFENLQRLSHELESTLQQVRDGEVPLTSERADVLFKGLDLSKTMVDAFEKGESSNEDIDELLNELKSADKPSSGSHRFRLEVFVDSTGREAFLRAFLLRSRLSAVATILSEQPAPETLKDAAGRFTYAITLVTEGDEQVIRAAANIDQVAILSIVEEQQAPEDHSGDEPEAGTETVEAHDHEDRSSHHDEVVRVSVERLDNLLNLVGELVVQNSNFTSLSEDLETSYGRSDSIMRLQEKTEGLAKITRDLQDGIMKVRMLPVNTVFMRFHRVVRDLSKSSGKEVTLDIFGGETEIDKKVIDRIGDPLVHLIRNAVDHGIESREQRIAAGKPATSSVRLGAYQDGDHICIEVSDDGRGLDRQAILKKAREKGLVAADVTNLAEEEILGLIFVPGFSTAERVTDVSGRGVGMDAVKQTIEALGGSLRIRSVFGRGTTVTITLPLTMAIIRAVLVEVEYLTVAIPLSSVKEVLKVNEHEIRSVALRQVIRLRDEVLAIVHLREALGISSRSTRQLEEQRFPVIVVDYDNRKVGLGVDRVVGTHEIVIKSLSRHYEEVEGFIGASILGDGRIALIIDVEAIVRQLDHESTEIPFENRQAFEAFESATAPLSEADPGPGPDPGPAPRLNASVDDALEFLGDVGSSGALRASMALSQLTATEVRVSFPESDLIKVSEVADILGGEEAQILGIYVGIAGGITGGILIAISADKVLKIHDYLTAGRRAATNVQAPVDLSVLAEFGNILSASFINAISDESEIRIRSEAPEISNDMCLSILDSVVARFNRAGDRTLLTKAVVYFGDEEQIGCSLILFVEPESLDRLLSAATAVAV